MIKNIPTYHEKMKQKNILKLREMVKILPDFCADFFRGIAERTSEKTRIAYAYDLESFFEFLVNEIDIFKNINDVKQFNLESFATIMPIHIEKFLEYSTFYIDPDTGKELKNGEKGKGRKLATLRSIYKYFLKNEALTYNPAELVDTPKIHEKAIVRLETNEVADLLDNVEKGNGLTKKQQTFHDITNKRDLALITLLLGTGIRVSECVGLNINDIDFENNSIKIIRKGGNEVILYFSDEVCTSLLSYLEERKNIATISEHEHALFLSIQKKRIGVRAVENLVKKYAKVTTPLKNISPHKLRSTFGTNLYRETGDIYIVADVLGHKDVNTTKKHYAAIDDAQRRNAARSVRLRED